MGLAGDPRPPNNTQLFRSDLEGNPVLNCRQVSELVSQAKDRRLGWLETLRLHAHLRVCEGCRHFQQQVDFLREAIRRHPALRDDNREE